MAIFFKAAITGIIAAGLLLAGAGGASAEECVVDTIHHEGSSISQHEEYRYKQVTPGHQETFFTEYRFKSRTWIESKQEFKDVEDWRFIDGGTTRVNGQTIGGHWVSAAGTGYNHVPAVIINIVWGPSGVPDQYLGTGSVNLSQYGGPNVTVRYKAYAEDFSGWSDWGPWSGWSTENPGASNDTMKVEPRPTSNGDSIPEVTVYYVPGGEPSSDLTDANWTTDVPAGWTLVDKQAVTDHEAISASDENVYGECEPELAETGTDSFAIWLWTGVGVSVVALGILLLVIRRVRND